jgi:hypothetical protein
MALVSINQDGVLSLSIAQRPNDLTPTFAVQMFPDQASFLDHESWLGYSPPDMTFNIGGVEWPCTAREVQTTITPESGVILEVQYYPELLETLQTTGYGKHLVFLSCPQWQYDQLIKQYDTDEYEVVYKPSNVYISTGWTIQQIFTKIGSSDYADVDIDCLVPTLHVPQATVICEKGQSYFEFLQSLLPSGFLYAWNVENETVKVSLLEPSTQTFQIPDGFFATVGSQSMTPTYTLIEATAGDYKPASGLSLGRAAPEQGFTVTILNRHNEIVTEVLAPETKAVGNYEETTQVTRTFQTDPDGNFFALLSEITETHGPLFNKRGNYLGIYLLKRVVTDYTYENSDPMIYRTPRLTQRVTKSSGYVNRYIPGAYTLSYGTMYYLTENLDVITYASYAATAVDERPDIVCSAYATWEDDYETITETKTYTQTTTVTPDFFEGSERDNSLSTTRLITLMDNRYYDCLASRESSLQQLAQDLQDEDTPSVTPVGQYQLLELVTRKIKVISPDTYQFEDTRKTFNTSTKSFEIETQASAIDSGRPPSLPTQYRVKQLRASIGSSGSQNVVPLHIHVPTNNPDDAEEWWSIAYKQKTQTQRQVVLTSFDRFVPVGSRIAKGTVTSFQLTQTSQGEQQVVLTVI